MHDRHRQIFLKWNAIEETKLLFLVSDQHCVDYLGSSGNSPPAARV